MLVSDWLLLLTNDNRATNFYIYLRFKMFDCSFYGKKSELTHDTEFGTGSYWLVVQAWPNLALENGIIT